MPEGNLEFVFAKVERLVREMATGGNRKKETLSALFEMNNEIGRRARVSPHAKRNLVPLQQCVNALTVAVKSADSKLMEDSLAWARQALENLGEVAEDRA